MMQLLQPLLRDYLGLALVAVVILLLIVLWMLVRLARGSQARSQIHRAQLAPESAEEAIDLTVPPPRPDLRRSFARARAGLRRAFPGRAAGYQRPWVLVLGPALVGKTTLLGKSGIGLPFGQPRQRSAPDHPGINWWAMEGGIALDIVGEDLLRLDGLSSDTEEWKSILRQIRRNRPRRPIDGIVLTLPAGAFLDQRKPLAQRLAEASRRGTLIHRKLGEAQRALGMQAPVYLLISHCDRIPGFNELLMSAGAAGAQGQQMLGWSNPASPRAPYSAAWIDQAFDKIRTEVDGFQLQRLADRSTPPSPEAVLLPNRLLALREPLRIYANQIFSRSATSEPLTFRGFYLCGGGVERPRPADVKAPSPVEMPTEVAFVADLLNRKVFPEAAIARPTPRAAMRARIWRSALAGLSLVALLWTAWAIWRGEAAVRSSAAAVQPFLETIATRLDGATLDAGSNPTGDLSDARSLFAAGGAVPTFRLRSAALPASWLSGLPGRVNDATERGFLSLAFAPSRQVLARRAEQLIVSKPPEVPETGAVSTIYAIEGYPEFQALDRLTRDLERLDRTIAGYQLFAARRPLPTASAVEEFNRVAVATLDDQLRPRGRGPARFYGRRLSGIGAAPFDHQEKRYNQRLESKVIAWAQRFFDAAFTANPLTYDLDGVLGDWIAGGATLSQRPSEVEQYRDLFTALRLTQRHIELPELQWTAADTLDLGPRFDAVLRRIHNSPFLGPEVSDRLKREALARFARLQEELGIYSTTDTGPLLLRQDQAWVLSPKLQAVFDGLTGLLGESFMQRRCIPIQMDPSPAGRNLFWKAKPLEEALSLWTTYQGWDGSSELPPPLQNTSPEVASQAVADNIVCLIAEAQSLEYPPATDDAAVVEDDIKLQVQNLQASEQSLTDLLDALGRLELRSAQAEVAQILRRQRIHILGQLDRLLDGLDLYAPLDGGFSWWQGDPGPALEAFGATSSDELDSYLETQRDVATRLANEYAQPLLAMFGASGQLALIQKVQPATKWQRLVDDIAAYDGKQPGNPLIRLEELITTLAGTDEPELFDLYHCFGDALPANGAAGGDFFLAKRQAVRGALTTRCSQLADQIGYQKYVELALTFNKRLEGNFPFAPPSAMTDATPEEIRAFFDADFAKALLLIENLPQKSVRFGDTRDAAIEFMRRMDAVGSFFATFLAPEAKSPNPIYDLAVRFRIERDRPGHPGREQGANQIISWLLSVGEEAGKGDKSRDGEKILDLLTTGSVSPAEDAKKPLEPDARWLYGSPVTLIFRWASGSPFAPFAPAGSNGPPRATADGSTLVYKYREPWSLLRLLAENKAQPEDFDDLSDPQPETVKLSIRTVRRAEPEDEPVPVADVYLQITLLAPDENTELAVPDFPTRLAPLTEEVVPAPEAE